MKEPHDPNRTIDIPPSAAADSLDAGLAAGFGKVAGAPRSSLDPSQRPVLLKEAEGESNHIVNPSSDAMPDRGEAGDRYQLFGEIARGGMGAVLRGRDADLGRDLAVKVLLERHAGRPEVARRFLEEAQIGGQLQHPGVVPVYDIGRFGERPFFTMKLIKGKTLAALLAERAGPGEELPRLLGDFLKVAQAVAYAHAKGVIHRDLKPSNVMVGAFGEVQVMDWGLAKVLAEGGVADEEKAGRQHHDEGTMIRTARSGTAGSHGTETEAGSLLGTPAYMPPEQAQGDVANLDRRCDVFGLGAILCEILTGKPPHVGRSTEEVRRKAANGDLADARARLDGCGADQELIDLTKACLSPEAIDRPKDALAVSESLTAYLDGVRERLRQAELAHAAEVARTEEARATAAQERKARRLTLALAATVLLALAAGGGGWLWIKVDRDARQAQMNRDVNDALNRAVALREQARAAPPVGSAALFARAREQAQRALVLAESGPADAPLVAQVRRLQAELDEEEKDRRLIVALDEARLAQAETVTGERRFAQERAIPLLREAFRAYGLPVGQGEANDAAERIRNRPSATREAIVAALDEWDGLVTVIKLPEPHQGWLRAVLEAAESQDGWTRRFRVARSEQDPEKRRAALERLAAAPDAAQLPPRALTRLAALLDPAPRLVLLRRAQRRHPADFWVNYNLGRTLQNMTPPEWDESVRFLTAAAALRPHSPASFISLGYALGRKGLVDEAVAAHSKAVELDPKEPVAHYSLGTTYCDVKRDYDAAIACFRRAIELDPKLANAHTSLGIALKAKGQVDEAMAAYRRAIELDPKNVKAHADLGAILCDVKGDFDGAIACFRKVIELDPKSAGGHTDMGVALYRQGKTDAAIASCRRAIEVEPTYVKAHYGLGLALLEEGRVDEAIAWHEKAVALAPKDAFAHLNLGVALNRKGRAAAAIASFRKAVELNPKFANAHYCLAATLHGEGEVDEAITSYRKAITLDPKLAPARAQLARAERMAAVRDKLPALQSGSYTPTSVAERAVLIEWCRVKKLHRTSVRLYAEVFAASPRLADDLRPGLRYNAACHAALAAAGQGKDADKLNDKERTRLRKQALDWLRADLAQWGKQLDSGKPADRAVVQQTLRHWQEDSDLAGIRDEDALEKLLADEQKAFGQLWSDVAALLKKAEEKAK